jgi:nucleotide-binding universal stress UspA family protein
MKKILVPCDFSRESREAYKTALDIASKTKGKIILLHALYIPTYAPGIAGEPLVYDPVYFNNMEEDARTELEKMKAEATKRSIDVTVVVVFGEIVSSIKRTIETEQIEVVIMGTSGATGMFEIFIGSTTEKVVRHSPVPVLALRKAINISAVKNILLPSTLSLDQTEFVDKVKELQTFFNATLHLLLINTPIHFRRDSEAQGVLEEYIKHYKLKNFQTHFRNYMNEQEGIVDFAISEKMDLIAMGTHARKGLAHIFNVSVTEGVVNHLQSPVWTYCLHK